MKTRRWALVALCVAVALGRCHCPAPCDSNPRVCAPLDAGPEVSVVDVVEPDATDADVDADADPYAPQPSGLTQLADGGCATVRVPGVPPPPWADCVVRLQPRTWNPPPTTTTRCGPGRFLRTLYGSATYLYRYASDTNSVWLAQGGAETRLSDGATNILEWVYSDDIRPQTGRNLWLATLFDGARSTVSVALGTVPSGETIGRVLFSGQYMAPPPHQPGDIQGMGASNLVATDEFLAFRLFAPGMRDGLYTANPDGTDLHRVPFENPGSFGLMSASGTRLAFNSDLDLYLFDVRTRQVERLTNDGLIQADNRLVGEELVFWEGRGSGEMPVESDVWILNVRTRARTAVTLRNPPLRAVRMETNLTSDWVVWSDLRNGPDPLHYEPNHFSIYGLHRPSGTEVPLVRGVFWARAPFLFGDHQLLYSCQATETDAAALYVMTLPEMPAGSRDQ